MRVVALPAALLLSLLVAHAQPAFATDPAMSIERLYALPSIAGTSPESGAWSRDGRSFAFLWNDRGRRFRDLWVQRLGEAAPRQLTRLAQARPDDSQHWGISELAWLADGRLVFVLDGRLHGVGTDGTVVAREPERAGVSTLRLAPTGRELAFLSDGALWIRGTGTAGQASARRQISPEEGRVFVERYEWSRDGSRILFVQADNRDVRLLEIPYSSGGEQHVYRTTRSFPGEATTKRRVGVHEIATGRTTWLERGDERRPIWALGLSGDGGSAFVDSSDFLIKERTIDLYDVRTGRSRVFHTARDPKRTAPRWSAAWAPGDSGLILLSDHDGWFHLYHQARAGGKPRQLTRGNWEVHAFEVDARGGFIYFQANEAHVAERHLYRVRASGGHVERLTRAAGTHDAVLAPGYTHAIDRFSSDTSPPEMFLLGLDGHSAPLQVTRSPLPEFGRLELADVSYVRFPSHVDGASLVGRLMRPRSFDPAKRYPLIVGTIYSNVVRNQWGGGTALPTWGLDQHLVDRGYLVFTVDVRGSWGHGAAMREKLMNDFGGIDAEDVASGVKYLLSQGFADPARIGIWGWSYGGLMTLMSLYRHPELYAAGYADAPATNMMHAYPEQMRIMGVPHGEDFPERYRRMSALYHTEKLTRPLLITHATRDERVLYADTVALVERLIAGGKQFELVSMPGSNHVWAADNLEQLRFGYRKAADFFERHVPPR